MLNHYTDLGKKHKVKIKFILVGLWNTLFGYGLFVILEILLTRSLSSPRVAYMSAMVIAQVVAILNAYYFHKRITFGSRTHGIETIFELARFSTTYAFTFGISLVLLPALVELGHFDPKLAGAVITLIYTVVSYMGHSRFSFRSKNREATSSNNNQQRND